MRVSLEPYSGVKPDPTAATHVDVEERSIREAPYPCKESGALCEEAFDVGAVDVGDAKVERPSLRVACGFLGAARISVALHDGNCLPGKCLSQRGEQAGESPAGHPEYRRVA